MNKYYIMNVSLTLKGPLITSGGGDMSRGLNRIFYRNAEGDFILQGSHVKGKLREAITELKRTNINVASLFGAETGNTDNEKTNYLPQRAKLNFEDFILQNYTDLNHDRRLTRVSIDSITGTSKESFLQTIEALFPSGSLSVWSSKIKFVAANDNAAEAMLQELTIGLKWITALGAIKGSGYGRLEEVSTTLEVCKSFAVAKPINPANHEFTLIFEFSDDLFVGGVTKSTNYNESQKVIPGAVIKGSLARFLNEICGETDLTKYIDENNAAVVKEFDALARHFSNLEVSHAFPAPPLSTYRPVTVPFSSVEVTTETEPYLDVALCKGPALDKNSHAPKFQIDWKNPMALNDHFGWGQCEIINKTRTAIHSQARAAAENKLYTFQYITPFSADYDPLASDAQMNVRSKIRWFANVNFPLLSGNQTEQMIQQFEQAIHAGWHFMGKRNARFIFELKDGRAPARIIQHGDGVLSENLAIIILQTDALLFDGRHLIQDGKANDEELLTK